MGGRVPSCPSSLPFHICSLTSSALSWERTGCLSKGAQGEGSQQSQEAELWGWLAGWQPGHPASLPPAPCCSGAGPAHPLGTNKQETDTNLALAPSNTVCLPPPQPHWPRTCPPSPWPQNLRTSQMHEQNQAKRYGLLEKNESFILKAQDTRFYTLN